MGYWGFRRRFNRDIAPAQVSGVSFGHSKVVTTLNGVDVEELNEGNSDDKGVLAAIVIMILVAVGCCIFCGGYCWYQRKQDYKFMKEQSAERVAEQQGRASGLAMEMECDVEAVQPHVHVEGAVVTYPMDPLDENSEVSLAPTPPGRQWVDKEIQDCAASFETCPEAPSEMKDACDNTGYGEAADCQFENNGAVVDGDLEYS